MNENRSNSFILKSKSISTRANFKKLTLNDSSSNTKVSSTVKTSSNDVTSNADSTTNSTIDKGSNGGSNLQAAAATNKPLFQKSLNRLNKPKLNLFGNLNKSSSAKINDFTSNGTNNSTNNIANNGSSNTDSRSSSNSTTSTNNGDNDELLSKYIMRNNSVSSSLSANSTSTIGNTSPLNYKPTAPVNPLKNSDNGNSGSSSSSTSHSLSDKLKDNRKPTKENKELEMQLSDIVQLGKIGSGNSGTVLKVLHVPTQKIIAKKIIPLNNIFNGTGNNNKDIMLQVKKQIVRELSIMQKIGKHDNIVEFYSAFYNTMTNSNTKLVTPLSTLTIELNGTMNGDGYANNYSRSVNSLTSTNNPMGITRQHIEIEQVSTTTDNHANSNFNSNANATKSNGTGVHEDSTIGNEDDIYKKKIITGREEDDGEGDGDDKQITNEIIILMEYMNLGSLDRIISTYKNHCRRCRVAVCPETSWFNNEVYISKISYGVLSGLYFLYQNFKIIHRDIKPSNILINSKGFVKICDFGVSKKMVDSIADTFVGTSTYMSPERIQGGIYTTKGDVWSLGLMVIELLSGRFPLSSNKFKNKNTVRKSKTTKITSKIYPGDIIIEEEEEDEYEDDTGNGNGDELDGALGYEDDMDDTPDGILDLLQRIVNEPSPTLPDYKNMYSAELRDFVNKCCIKDESERGSLKELLEHPLITKYNTNPDSNLQRNYNHEFKHWCKNIKKLIHDEKLIKRQEQIQSLNLKK